MRIGLALATVATAFAVATAVPAAPFYVTTGQAGGAFSLDAGESRIWTIVPQGTETQFGGGIFMMKRGAGVSVGITLALYDDGNSMLISAGYANSSFVGQDYSQISFLMAGNGLVMNLGDTYTVRLTVDAGTPLGGDNQYFFQGNTDTLTLDTRPPEEITLGATNTPEPASALLLAAGVLGLAAARQRHRRAA